MTQQHKVPLTDLQIKALKKIIRYHLNDLSDIEGETLSSVLLGVYNKLGEILPFAKEVLTEDQRASQDDCVACSAYRSEGIDKFCPIHREGSDFETVKREFNSYNKAVYSYGNTSEVL